ncbi:hypothetical protein VFPFJ_10605 [Purpureocillium lilacinum]|uniref:Uncharacterized protein n=1 Tax=Purpureocillium lilacinum TaxID=33203 RepID=A0A179GHK6_PURLI|nr:hypothetical protein VFPFJ_10605 [Purpureocillium lilacinum]OAQ76823.1 hypothetical protein VFPFJ_10605 [Purpureocillium lilacinum]
MHKGFTLYHHSQREDNQVTSLSLGPGKGHVLHVATTEDLSTSAKRVSLRIGVRFGIAQGSRNPPLFTKYEACRVAPKRKCTAAASPNCLSGNPSQMPATAIQATVPPGQTSCQLFAAIRSGAGRVHWCAEYKVRVGNGPWRLTCRTLPTPPPLPRVL